MPAPAPSRRPVRGPARAGLALAALGLIASACGSLAATRPAPHTPRPALPSPPAALTAYWVGHATVLVALKDRWIITDPVFSDRVGGVTKRRVAPGLDLAALPPLACALVSHAHLDHLDRPSLARLPGVTVIAPPGAVGYVPRGGRTVVALGAWQSWEQDGLRVTAVPVRHGDGRYGVDELYATAGHTGYVIEHAGLTVFFAGDTAYDPQLFKAIGRRFPAIDLALIPVGPTGHALIRPVMRHMHVDPAEALTIFAEVGARWMVPIHHSTFFRDPDVDMAAIRAALSVSPLAGRVFMLAIGESVTLEPRGAASAPAERPAVPRAVAR